MKLLARLSIDHMRIHDLRHTAAVLMIAQKIEPKMISEILGHSRIGITMDLYGHLFDPMRREAADRMDDMLGEQS
jgi:integrase